ncbi:glycosyltransferase family protein [Mailhella sp.]
MKIDKIQVNEHVKIATYAFLHKFHIISRSKFHKKYEKYFSKIKDNILKSEFNNIKHYGCVNNGNTDLRAFARGTIGILTAPHTEFIASCIADVLDTFNIRSDIRFEYRQNDQDETFYIVISPNYFSQGLPKNYFVFNVEQSISERWFTEDYFAKLNGSYGVLDYSLKNIDYLNKHDVKSGKIFYAKLFPRVCSNLQLEHKTTPILFYGDTSCERRKKMLERLGQKFSIKIINNMFHEDMLKELDKAKIVLNIHYYENAMLETTRLCEALSHGCMVISEKSITDAEYPELKNLVDFVDIDDVDAMEARLQYWLENQELLDKKIVKNNQQAEALFKNFEFFIARFLLYYDLVSFEAFYRHMHKFFDFADGKVCIGLPEAIERADYFSSVNKYGFNTFPGLKFPIGWIGCGMTYKFLARKALEEGRKDLLICEDDVEFFPDFAERFDVTEEYFSKKDVDAFSGFIVDLHPEAVISSIENYNGVEFITVNKLVSMVYGHYGLRILEKLSQWDETNIDTSNTIDRYLENCIDMKIAFAHPFLVGHNEEQFSTLWKIKNNKYNELLKKSIQRIEEKKKAYLAKK